MAGETNVIVVHQSLVTKIVTKYLSQHQLTPEQIPELIASVHRGLNSLGQVAAPPPVLTPAVPVRRSVQRDAVVCLDCGWKGKMLRRHLTTRHHLTGAQYLARWSLPNDHPLTAPMYSEQRSVLARELGLGRGGRAG
jgi:predicted transcriptional regulator